MSHENYYLKLSLPPVPPLASAPTTPVSKPTKAPLSKPEEYQESDPEKHILALIDQINYGSLQNQIKTALGNLITHWTKRNDLLLESLDDLKKSKKKLDQDYNIQSQQYRKAIKETKFYRAQYENQLTSSRKKNNPINSNNIVAPDNTSYSSSRKGPPTMLLTNNDLTNKANNWTSSTSTLSSYSSSVRTSSLSLVDELVDSVAYDSNDEEDDKATKYSNNSQTNSMYIKGSLTSSTSSITLPTPSYLPMSPLSIKFPSDDFKLLDSELAAEQNKEQPKVMIPGAELTFACGEGFWDTIAKGKSEKEEVKILVSNYINRKGNPNVAKISETVMDVKEGYSLVHALVAVQNTDGLHKVLEAGANVNVYPLSSKIEDKIHPLVLAAKLGYISGFKLLCQKGGKALLTLAKGPYGETALHAAIQSESDDMVQYILRNSPTLLETADNNGAMPLHYACITGNTKLATLFIQYYRCKPDPQDNKGETPLHYAVRNCKPKVIEELIGKLQVDPNPYIRKKVHTPLDVAKARGAKHVVEYLKLMGAKTTKEMEKLASTPQNGSSYAASVYSNNSSNGSVFSSESNLSRESITGNKAVIGVKKFINNKTTQILKSSFDH